MGELVHQVLRALAADLFPDGPGGMGPDPLGDRAGEVVGTAERGIETGAGDLELADGGDHVDGVLQGAGGPGVREGGPGRGCGKVGGGEGGIVRGIDPFRRFADADDHGRAVVGR